MVQFADPEVRAKMGASERLAELQKMDPLDVPVEELLETITAAQAAGVEARRIERAQKKAKYATQVQTEHTEREKQEAEWHKPTLQDSFDLLNNCFGYHGFINREHNLKVLGKSMKEL
uniref:Uncharacterized protein n=1 Tax=Prymnesium polylepis TaxID=72548 RepID=A0A7S4J0W0_9EUKA|mmetsp:Transcript_376/g.683  ORF Transcript_376/g.683 Transcript_376/m.683 type:complete len:118 (+) Transcript_376:52-405(+)|eukprot:2718839-Prymnesium_polylepis.1